MLVDAHAHLDMLTDPVTEVLKRAAAADVGLIISVGDKVSASQKAVNLAAKYPNVKAAVGVHPHEAKTLNKQTLKELEHLAKQPGVVAIGETGLDFFKQHAPRSEQITAFKEQLNLAKELNLPVILHCRDAYKELTEIISAYLPHPFLVHCFSGSLQEANVFLEMGCLLSFTGIITFKQAEALREVVKQVPLEKIVIETDAPFLTPEPYRGQKNEPAFVRYTALKLAELKQLDLAAVAKQTTLNAKNFLKGHTETPKTVSPA